MSITSNLLTVVSLPTLLGSLALGLPVGQLVLTISQLIKIHYYCTRWEITSCEEEQAVWEVAGCEGVLVLVLWQKLLVGRVGIDGVKKESKIHVEPSVLR